MANFKLYHTKSAEPEYVAARFWSKVDKSDGCWEWSGSRQGPGYGLFKLKGRLHKAHRVALMLSGVEVPDHLCVLHSCDNPPCCNPAHLRLGTKGENNVERSEKFRSAAKLTPEDVREIRRLRAHGATQAQAAARFGVARETISSIERGISWSHA